MYIYFKKKKKTESWFEECVTVFLLDTSPSPPNSLAAKIPQDMEAGSYFGSVVEIKHWPKATQGGKRGFISSYKLQCVITRENQDRNWRRQEPQGGRN